MNDVGRARACIASNCVGRDGEALAADLGPGHDNSVRYPQHNTVARNVFHDLGVWDKQCAAFTKHLAPHHGTFEENVVFNTSRHGVNYQDGKTLLLLGRLNNGTLFRSF